MKTALYRHFDAQGQLLYVGISRRPVARLHAHTAGSHWAEEITLVSIEWHSTRAAAEFAEWTAIGAELPLHNLRRTALPPRNSPIMAYVSNIVEAFGGVRPMAATLNLPVSTVHSWSTRGSIPDKWKPVVMAKAIEREINLTSADFFPQAKAS